MYKIQIESLSDARGGLNAQNLLLCVLSSGIQDTTMREDARARSGTIMQMRSCSDITAARASIPFHPVLFFSLVRSFAHLPSRVSISQFQSGPRQKSCACAFVNVIWHLFGSACY
jgi:hypothetical protein